jgi:hypothetical protein
MIAPVNREYDAGEWRREMSRLMLRKGKRRCPP